MKSRLPLWRKVHIRLFTPVPSSQLMHDPCVDDVINMPKFSPVFDGAGTTGPTGAIQLQRHCVLQGSTYMPSPCLYTWPA